MDRRGFLKGILAAGVAPYVITTPGLLMPVRGILVPSFHKTQGSVRWVSIVERMDEFVKLTKPLYVVLQPSEHYLADGFERAGFDVHFPIILPRDA